MDIEVIAGQYKEIKIGYEKGETCNRDGCKGIIEEHDLEHYGLSGCSCHINPPCSACTKAREYCPECDWSHEEEIDAEFAKRPKQKEVIFKIKTHQEKMDELDRTKLDYFISKTWHSGMEVTGVYPEGTTKIDILNKLRVSENPNMPRFKRFTDGIFVLTYFTD